MAYAESDLTAVETAVLELAKGERVVSLSIAGRSAQFDQSDMDKLRALRAEIKAELQATAKSHRFVLTTTSKGL